MTEIESICIVLLLASVLALLHTYVFYPIIIYFIARSKNVVVEAYSAEDDLPFVSIIMPVHNEAKLIAEKISSLQALNYPKDKVKWFIGSDNSTDATNSILENYDLNTIPASIFYLPVRTGKPGVVNYLYKESIKWHPRGDNHINLFTDASVMLEKDSLFNLVKHFKDSRIGMVDAYMKNIGIKKENISISEGTYVSTEVKIKNWESKAFLTMIGPFGGCFAMRSTYFESIPDNFLVDDFFLCMNMYQKGGKAINSMDAISYETVSQELKEEFRRKARISAGNLQNLGRFLNLWFPPFNALGFCIFSHKVLRWFGPWFILLSGILLAVLSFISEKVIYRYGLILYLAFFILVPLTEKLFKNLGIQNILTKNINYFIWMNLALLKGFIDYAKGIKSNVWRPTKRY